MIYTVLRGKQSEMKAVEQIFREETAYCSDERFSAVYLKSKEELEAFLEKKESADIICVDVTVFQGVAQAERMRRFYPDSMIILLADDTISPITYMKPSIYAAALMLRPLSAQEIKRVYRDVFNHLSLEEEQENLFVIETREDKQRLPYGSILYFEARSKKVYACTANKEYGFYETIDHLEEQLGDMFVRCHRSYLVNVQHIEKVRLSANCIFLKGDIEVPLSRSCKERVKELNL